MPLIIHIMGYKNAEGRHVFDKKGSARVLWNMFCRLHPWSTLFKALVRVHWALRGHYRVEEHSKFESPTFKEINRQVSHGSEHPKAELKTHMRSLETLLTHRAQSSEQLDEQEVVNLWYTLRSRELRSDPTFRPHTPHIDIEPRSM